MFDHEVIRADSARRTQDEASYKKWPYGLRIARPHVVCNWCKRSSMQKRELVNLKQATAFSAMQRHAPSARPQTASLLISSSWHDNEF